MSKKVDICDIFHFNSLDFSYNFSELIKVFEHIRKHQPLRNADILPYLIAVDCPLNIIQLKLKLMKVFQVLIKGYNLKMIHKYF